MSHLIIVLSLNNLDSINITIRTQFITTLSIIAINRSK